MSRTLLIPILVATLLGAALEPARAQSLLRVPQDVADLQQAINQIADGGVIQLAAGTYAAPNNGFRIRNLAKAFTIRAAAGAAVVLDGEGSHTIVRFENGDISRGGRVVFQGLTFRNGFSSSEILGGAVSVIAAEATFLDCLFEDNVASPPTTGGGAARVADGSVATFVDCTFNDNSARTRGGALEVIFATAYVARSRFEGNRVNLPGHESISPGGAIYLLDSKLRVYDTHFEGNQAGWTGGAIYGFGLWANPVTVPATDVLIVNCDFVDNRAVPDAGSPPPGVTVGGALHAEDQTVMRVYQSRFLGNRAERGGAIDTYRSKVEVFDSVFRGNQAISSGLVAAGGAILVTSADFNDASTNFGALNRPPGELLVERSFFQGRFGGAGVTADNGGCISAAGDQNRQNGTGGVPQNGTAADNRAPVVLRQVVFFDCDVERPGATVGGFGGAMNTNLVDLQVFDSQFLNSDTTGQGTAGGALALFSDTHAEIDGTTFANNSAERFGGAIYVTNSHLEVTDSFFFGNEISPGVAEAIGESRGAAIFSIPTDSAVTGFVSSTVFSANIGVPIFEVDLDDGPINDLRYNGNQFFESTFGDRVFVNILVRRSGESVAELNALKVMRANGTSTDKSTMANAALASRPKVGSVLAVPATLHAADVGDTPAGAFITSGWAGGVATLNGLGLAGFSNLREVDAAGTFILQVGGSSAATAQLGTSTCTTGAMLCLNDNRFRADVTWRDFRNRTGVGNAELLTSDTGYFWFFKETNVEIALKLLDGRSNNNHYWVFYGSLSNVEQTATVLEMDSGRLNTYINPARNFASFSDNTAFPATAPRSLGADAEVQPILLGSLAEAELSGGVAAPSDPAKAGTCAPSDTTLCVNGNRFEVSIHWTRFNGESGEGHAVALTNDTGYFWFFKETNIEVVLKVLDGTNNNGFYWVFYGALTNVEYEITIRDTETGFERKYINPPRNFASVGDTMAIPGE